MMMIKTLSATVATAALLLAGTVPGSIRDARAGDSHYQTANLHDFVTGADRAGAGTITRTKNSASAAIRSSDLDPDTAYTIWWVVFNNPAACAGPCGIDDLGVAAVKASVFYAAGFVTGSDGVANVDARLRSGALPVGIDVLIPGGLMPGNGLAAEIHMIIRSHGAIIAGDVDIQVGTFNGTCDVNICEDQQAVAFPAIEADGEDDD